MFGNKISLSCQSNLTFCVTMKKKFVRKLTVACHRHPTELMHCYLLLRPVRKYYKKLSKQLADRDVESGQDDGDELQSIRVDRNQPQQYCTPCQQEFMPVSYQNPGTKSIFKSVGYVTVFVNIL